MNHNLSLNFETLDLLMYGILIIYTVVYLFTCLGILSRRLEYLFLMLASSSPLSMHWTLT